MSVSVTFDEIERNTERAMGYAFLAKTTTATIWLLFRLVGLSNQLDTLVRALTADKIQRLTPDQITTLGEQLRMLHRLLRELGTSEEIRSLWQIPFFRSQRDRLQERTEALSDVLDDFALIGDPSVRRLLSDCASSIGL
jgi:hypothetical protein